MTDSNVEIERKFLVNDDGWRGDASGERIVQGFLSTRKEATVRVRLGEGGASLTVKGAPVGLTAPEFEYPIPRDHAESMLVLCADAIVEKTRYRILVENHVFEVDVFEGRNRGLVIAEVELESEDEAFPRPAWLGREVSHDPRYKNARLALEPFRPDWIDVG